MLLDIVALAGDESRDGLAGGQTHTRRLAFARVGLLGPREANLDAHALALRVVAFCEGGRRRVASSSLLSAALWEVFWLVSKWKESRKGGRLQHTRRTCMRVAFWVGVEEKERMEDVMGCCWRKEGCETAFVEGIGALRSEGIKERRSNGIAMIVWVVVTRSCFEQLATSHT